MLFGVALLSPGGVAAASEIGEPTAGGTVSGDTVLVGIIAPGEAGSSGPVPAGSPAAPRPYTYTWVPLPPPPVPSGNACADGFGGIGQWYALVIRDLAGAVVANEPRCIPLDPDGTPALPELPPVPTIGDIWAAALRDITHPVLGINPRPTGLTGLETWLWYEGPSELGVSASIGEFTVTGTAHLREVTFDMGDGEVVTASTPGSATAPAARHIYERKGTYDVEITATWEAELGLSGPGLPARPTPIGAAVLRSSEAYPVQEVRGLLVD
ncbi:MAG TPA: PKD domain-containing protein [Acidimicrobiia bacterium]